MGVKPQLEKDIQLAICDYLALRRAFFWRQNTMPVYDPVGKRFRSMPKHSLKGVPDIIVIGDGGVVIFIEVKRPGGKLSEAQLEFQKRCQSIGAVYVVATSIDDIIVLGI